MRIILAALLVISFTQGFSENKQTILGGVQLNLFKPDNLCEIKDTGPIAEIFEITDALQITAQNKLLAYFEDFKRLESLLDASKTKFLDYSPEYILITAYNPNHNEETLYTNYTTKRFNEEMASSVSDEDINEIFMKV